MTTFLPLGIDGLRAVQAPDLASYTNKPVISKDSKEQCTKDSKEIIVYVTKTGRCYHKNNKCSCLRYSCMSITLEKALENDYQECLKCFG